jgi:mannose-6-phosphate isomerase-like protein (cupin superfamily)
MQRPSSPEFVSALSADEKEAFHQEAESRVKVFRYGSDADPKRVRDIGGKKQVTQLANGDMLRLRVQRVREGGENNLHYHTGSETTWMVIRGRARFYGSEDKLVAELGPLEGILIPGGARYWFEKVGDDDLEVMQIVAFDRRDGAHEQRFNVDPHKNWMDQHHLQIYENSKS